MASSDPPAFVRQQLLVDGHVQTALLKRVALYSAACISYFLVILVFSETMADEGRTLAQCILNCLDEVIFWLPGFMLMAPLVVYDLLRFTNRFAGPMFSLRREMRHLIDGQSERPLTFRDGDHWNDMADLYNQIRQEMILLRDANAQLKQEATTGATVETLFDDDDNADVDADIDSAEADFPLDDLVAAVNDGAAETAGG